MFRLNPTPKALSKYTSNAESVVSKLWKQSKGIDDFALSVQEKFNSTHGFGWQVVIAIDPIVQLRYRQGCCLVLVKKSSYKLIIYRPAIDSTAPLAPLNLPILASKLPKHKILETDMSEEDLEQFTSIVLHFASLSNNITDEVMLQQLKAYLTRQFGPTWHLLSTRSKQFVSLPAGCEKGTYLSLSYKNQLWISMFQHAGNRIDVYRDLLSLSSKCLMVLTFMVLAIYLYLHSTCEEGQVCEQWKFVSFAAVAVCMMLGMILKVVKMGIGRHLNTN